MFAPLVLLACLSILTSGVMAVAVRSLPATIVGARLAGLFAALAFLLLVAPDAALAEAAIGSWPSTFILPCALRKTGWRKSP